MKPFKFLLLSFFVGVAVFIQLVPVDRSNPPVVSEVDAPAEVMTLLQRSCYDCHSNETRWPWYSRIAPVSWLVAYDVQEGREELNFSDWKRFGAKKKLLHEIVEEVEEGEMPLPIYLLTHKKAALSAEEVALLRTWVGELAPLSTERHHQDNSD